jgi:thioredoxin reductase
MHRSGVYPVTLHFRPGYFAGHLESKGLSMQFDVLIVGGGPAGLSAALILGRCHRTVLLCDEGHQRNLSSHVIHGLLGREGRSPALFLDDARADLSRYKSVSVRNTQAMAIDRAGEVFNFICADGTVGSASKILLATGLVDELPEMNALAANAMRKEAS